MYICTSNTYNFTYSILFSKDDDGGGGEGGFTGHGDRMAYKDMMKMPKKQSGFGF